jgi:cell wall-associated NlpC family hydrolase
VFYQAGEIMESIEAVLAEVGKQFADPRLNVFEVKLAGLKDNRVKLSGRVLERANLDVLKTALAGMEVDDSAVQVLRTAEPAMRWVATNLTSLHAGPGWLNEQMSQLLFGWKLEVLEEHGKWAFIRQENGYLGWAYLAFTSPVEPPKPTHIAIAPVSQVMAEPRPDAAVVTRLLGGTPVAVDGREGDWARVSLHRSGWVLEDELRALNALPQTPAARRDQIVADALELIGVPYLWGGCSANGIDCSGLAQLLHRQVGIELPRDADMQYGAGRKVEAPYQPGDLLFFGESGDQRAITHVAVSLGGWKIIHSSRSNNGVAIDEDLLAIPSLKESLVGAATYIE